MIKWNSAFKCKVLPYLSCDNWASSQTLSNGLKMTFHHVITKINIKRVNLIFYFFSSKDDGEKKKTFVC